MLLIIWLLCVAVLVSESIADTIWRAVNVDTNGITTKTTIEISEASSLRQCGTMCDRSSTCVSWNYENPVCKMTDLMVSPLHKSTTSDIIKLYTGMEKDFSVGSTVNAYSVQELSAYVANLANGIYNGKPVQTCYIGSKSEISPWILFILEATQNIQKISVRTRVGKVDQNPDGAEIRVGSTAPLTSGDFSSYKLFGKLPSTLQSDKTTYTVESTDGIIGRYVSVQKITSTSSRLSVCYVFIA